MPDQVDQAFIDSLEPDEEEYEEASQPDQTQVRHPSVPEVVQVQTPASTREITPPPPAEGRTVFGDLPAIQIGVDGPAMTLAQLKQMVARTNPQTAEAAPEPPVSELPRCKHKELCEDGEWYGCALHLGHKGKCVRGGRIDA
jgi:hypothetical protein